jgi:hypothetical protein
MLLVGTHKKEKLGMNQDLGPVSKRVSNIAELNCCGSIQQDKPRKNHFKKKKKKRGFFVSHNRLNRIIVSDKQVNVIQNNIEPLRQNSRNKYNLYILLRTTLLTSLLRNSTFYLLHLLFLLHQS